MHLKRKISQKPLKVINEFKNLGIVNNVLHINKS